MYPRLGNHLAYMNHAVYVMSILMVGFELVNFIASAIIISSHR